MRGCKDDAARGGGGVKARTGWASSRATSGCWRSAGMSLLYADTRSRKEQSKKRSEGSRRAYMAEMSS